MGEHTYSFRGYVADILNVIPYYIVASIVRNMLAVIIVMVFALDVVELAVLDENPGGFPEQPFEGFNHLARRDCALGFDMDSTNTSPFISSRRLYMGYIRTESYGLVTNLV